MRRFVRPLGILAIVAVPLVLSQLPPVRRALLALVEFMRTGGAAGVAAYVAVYGVAAVAAAPIALFSAMAGYAYGPVLGVLVASPASVAAAAVAFLVGRTLARDAIARRVGKNARWRAIDRAVSEDAFKVALLLRMTPLVPQNFLSYGLALTRVRLREYVGATFLGLLPITCLHVYVGSLAHDAAHLMEGTAAPPGPWKWASLALGLGVTVAAFVVTSRLARRALARVIDEPPSPEG